MKKLQFIICLGLIGLLVSCTRKPLQPQEGIYPVKLRTFAYIDLISDEIPENIASLAEVIESQPAQLGVAPEILQMKDLKFGAFKLGNTDQKTWFVIGEENGLWPTIYMDQDQDQYITVKEKIDGFSAQKGRGKKGVEVTQWDSEIPISGLVHFKSETGFIRKQHYFFIFVQQHVYAGKSELLIFLKSASFLDGEIGVWFGEEYKGVKIRIMDGNGNGCFNDYGADILSIDTNFDGYFTKKESRPLNEFFDFAGPDQQPKQLRLVVTAHPSKIAIVDAGQPIDRAQLEAASDSVTEED